jgi:phytoene dehydrogenase-like protein
VNELFTLARVGLGLKGLGNRDMMEAIRLIPISVNELLNDWFETEALKGAVGALGLSGLNQGPRAAGTALMLLQRTAWAGGALIARGQVKGGIGALTAALAAAATARGAEIRAGSEVAHILVREGKVTGVALKSGEEMAARQVVSNADPRRTLALAEAGWFDPEFLWQVNNLRMRGATAKINLALGELPKFRNAPEGDAHLRGTIVMAPDLDYLERASDAAKYGQISEHPFLEAVIPSLADPSLAPAGKHVMSLHAQYAPYKLSGGWNDRRRKELADKVVNTLAEYAPNLKKSILHQQVLSPADLENTFGLTEGNIHHGEMMLEQLFFMRPVGGAARYRLPLDGLYLCGAGAHPGGGVTGMPGRLAARAVLRG